jgi:hypothetical protein
MNLHSTPTKEESETTLKLTNENEIKIIDPLFVVCHCFLNSRISSIINNGNEGDEDGESKQ